MFISYSHQDEPYREDLEKHLAVLRRNGYIDTWTDRKIIPGDEWNNSIYKELLSAKIIVLLISSDFLASDFCYDIEMKTAVQRHNAGEVIVIPIIIRFCDWSNTPFSKLQGLPLDGKPLTDWENIDKAFLNVVEGIKIAINSLNTEQQSFNFRFGISLSEKLIEFRKRALSAEDELDFRKLKFDLSEFKKSHPLNFELEELERLADRGLQYEKTPSPKRKPTYDKSDSRPGCLLNIIILIFTLIALFIIHSI